MKYEAIAAYLAGECTAEQGREIDRWRTASPENEQAFLRYAQLWQASRQSYESYEPDMTKAWQRIKPVPERSRTIRPVPRKRQPSVFFRRMRVAAVLLVGVLIGLGIYSYPRLTDPAWLTTRAANGQKSRLELSDGTVVWLNAGSQLRYPAAFAEQQREVYLEGEGFFEVTRNPRRPFLIRTEKTLTKVLGTSFNVRAETPGGDVEVVVVTGSVSFAGSQPGEAVVLKPREKAVWQARQARIIRTTNDNANFLAWKTDSLIFRNTPLRQVLPTLEKYYRVRIQAGNPALLHCRFTGTFNRARLEEVLRVFAYGSDLAYQQRQNHYVLSGKGCPPNP